MAKNNRREFLAKTIAAGAAAFLPIAAMSKESETTNELPSLKGKKILFVYGGWDGHEPEKFKDYFVSWLKEEGADVQVSATLDSYIDKALMGSIDLVMQIMT